MTTEEITRRIAATCGASAIYPEDFEEIAKEVQRLIKIAELGARVDERDNVEIGFKKQRVIELKKELATLEGSDG